MVYVAYDPIYKHPLPDYHRFPMMKYELIPEQLIYEGRFSRDQFFSPRNMDESVIRAVHDEHYIHQLKTGNLSRKAERQIGFPYSHKLIERELCITYGTIQGALLALENGIAFNVAGGTHHAFRTGERGIVFLMILLLEVNIC